MGGGERLKNRFTARHGDSPKCISQYIYMGGDRKSVV